MLLFVCWPREDSAGLDPAIGVDEKVAAFGGWREVWSAAT